VEVKIGLQFLEVLQFALKSLSTIQQLKFGKNHNPCDNMWKMTTTCGKMFAKKTYFEQKNKNKNFSSFSSFVP
jgi:hypothetical protein